MIEYQNQLRSNLRKLSFQKKKMFGIDICERLFPEYLEFHKLNGFGEPKILKMGIDICVEYPKSNIVEIEINNIIQQIDTITPDTNDFGEILGSLALNAACSVSETLKFLIDSDDEHIFNAASYMYDTIDLQVCDKFPNLNDENIERHPLIINEIKWQLDKTRH